MDLIFQYLYLYKYNFRHWEQNENVSVIFAGNTIWWPLHQKQRIKDLFLEVLFQSVGYHIV